MSVRILVVEDDENTRHLLEVCLCSKQYEVELVEDAFEAQKYLSKKLPDLMLVDIMMPGMNGMDFCRWVRSQPRMKELPIIQMSALSDEITIQDSFETGVIDYIVKPINFDALYMKIDLAFSRTQRRQIGNER